MLFWIAVVIGIFLLAGCGLIGLLMFALSDDVRRMLEEESVPVSRGGDWGRVPGRPLPPSSSPGWVPAAVPSNAP